MSQLELAWAAGLFEGEGYLCIATPKGKGGRTTNGWRLGLEMTDKDVVLRFACLFDLSVKTRRRSKEVKSLDHWKDLYIAMTSHQAKVKEIVDALFPFMGERRRSKMEEFLGDFKAQCS